MTDQHKQNGAAKRSRRKVGHRADDFGLASDAFDEKRRKAHEGSENLISKLRHEKPTTYKVGYAKPPEVTRFLPGQSGNPLGRPIGAKSKGSVDQYAVRLRKIILEESSRMVTVNESGQPKEITIAEALMRSVVASALRGEARSQKMAIDLIAAAEASEQKENMALLATVIEYKDSWEKEKKRAERLGLALEVPYPHPDHIHIDTISGRIEIRGPRHKDDLPRFQWLWEQKQILIQNIRELILEISEDKNKDKAKALNKELKSKQTTLQKINFMLGDWKPD